MKKVFHRFELTEFRSAPFDALKPIDYVTPKDFPKDNDFHKDLFIKVKDWFDKFPHCCDTCPQLLTKTWFKKEDYEVVPSKIIWEISFVEFWIKKYIDHEDWCNLITEYIEYCSASFGEPSIGRHLYFAGIKHYLTHIAQTEFKILEEKKQKLLQFIDELENPKTSVVKEMTDPNELVFLFQKWLETIPDLEFFREFKTQHKGKAPMNLMFDIIRTNRFTKLSLMEIKKPNEFLDLLISFTSNLLNNAKTKILIKKGLISNIEQHEIDLIFEAHEKEQLNALKVGYSEHEFKYIEIMKDWLTREENFFEKHGTRIKKYFDSLKKLPSPQTKKPKDPTLLELFKKNQDRLDKFILLLQSDTVQALDKENNWIYNDRKSSIVACFQALEALELIKKITNKASLRRCIESEIKFAGNRKLFGNAIKDDDYLEFKNLFSNNLK